MFYFHLVFGCKERFAIWLSPNSCLMLFSSVASFEKCMGELVNWIVKYHFSTSSVSMKDTTKQCKVQFWPGILLGTKTWNPLLWLTEYTHKWVAQFWPGILQKHETHFSDGLYTQMGCSILTRDITKTWNPLLWQQSAFRDWPAHYILDEVNSLWIGWNCVLTSDLYIYVRDIYIGPKSVIRLLLIGWPQWFAEVVAC
jgi:hypothetical protein